MTHENCKLGDVDRQDGRWGFVVRGEHGKPLFSLAYETKAEAEYARGLMANVIEGAAVTPAPQ
jgi:hypothetical protein